MTFSASQCLFKRTIKEALFKFPSRLTKHISKPQLEDEAKGVSIAFYLSYLNSFIPHSSDNAFETSFHMPRAMPRYPCKPSVSLHHPSPHHNRRDSIRSLSPFQPNNKKKKSGYTNCSSQQRTDYCIIRKGEKVVITVNTNQKEQRRKKSSLARSSRALGSPLTPSCHSSTTARDLPARDRQIGTRPSVARSSCWR